MNKTTLLRAARRLSLPELRVTAKGSVGVYPRKGASEPCVNLRFDWDIAAPLLRAAAVSLALIAIVELLDD